MPKLAITTSVLEPRSALIERCLNSWIPQGQGGKFGWHTRHNTTAENLGVTGSLQWCYENTTAPIIAFLHSDVEIFEQGWDERVLREFNDPQVGVVGFGGALQLGEDDIYRTPYRLQQLRRIHYMSNQSDAETHGERFTGECDVATLDGFALVVRRALLEWCDGWPVIRYPFHNYDNNICLQAWQKGYRVRLVGVKCHHHGGRTTTTPAYQEWSFAHLGKTDQQVHEESHLRLYEDGRGWLPLKARVTVST